MSHGSFNSKIRFLGQKVCSVAWLQIDTRKWLLCAPFQGFRSFSFNLSSRIGPIYHLYSYMCLRPWFRNFWGSVHSETSKTLPTYHIVRLRVSSYKTRIVLAVLEIRTQNYLARLHYVCQCLYHHKKSIIDVVLMIWLDSVLYNHKHNIIRKHWVGYCVYVCLHGICIIYALL